MFGTALVTGAAGGIGAAVADRLDHAGYRVVRSDIGADGVDVRRRDDVERLCAAAGPVEVLVNAAGIYGERVPFSAADPEAWWSVVETNVRGPAVLCHAVLPGMVRRGTGTVVNLVSRAAVWDDPGQSSVAYSTSKAALLRFTGALAGEVAGAGVLVVGLSPGFVRTGMTSSRRDIDRLPESTFVPAAATAERVLALASRRYDELHGRFVHATDDLDDLVASVRRDPSVRTLRLVPAGPADPLL